MNVQIEDFKTGWFGITLGIKKSEVDTLIQGLAYLKSNPDQHFHIRSDYSGQGGIGDIELYIESDDVSDNAVIEVNPAIPPNR